MGREMVTNGTTGTGVSVALILVEVGLGRVAVGGRSCWCCGVGGWQFSGTSSSHSFRAGKLVFLSLEVVVESP